MKLLIISLAIVSNNNTKITNATVVYDPQREVSLYRTEDKDSSAITDARWVELREGKNGKCSIDTAGGEVEIPCPHRL